MSKVFVLFADPLPHLRATTVLLKVWVHLSDVPPCLRRADLLLEGTKMLGRPRVVDDESLATKDRPVRMLFHSPAPERLPKSIMLFANLQGFRIGVSVEFSKGDGSKPAGSDDKPMRTRKMMATRETAQRTKASLIVTRSGGITRTKKRQETGGSRVGREVLLPRWLL
jgi:hypothetical protein